MHVKEYFPPSKDELGFDADNDAQLSDLPLQVLTGDLGPESRGKIASIQDNDLESILLGPPFRLRPAAQDMPQESLSQPKIEAVEQLENPHQVKSSRQDFLKYLFTDGNWTDLFATSVTWMLLDFTFYLLGVNSTDFIPSMFGKPEVRNPPPSELLSYERQLMESTSVAGVVGSLAAIWVIHNSSRKKIQMWGFLILGIVFVVVGALYMTAQRTHAYIAAVSLYAVCQFFFSLGRMPTKPIFGNVLTSNACCTGPNTTTFVVRLRFDPKPIVSWLKAITDTCGIFPNQVSMYLQRDRCSKW